MIEEVERIIFDVAPSLLGSMRCDVGTIILVHPGQGHGVETVTLASEPVGVVTVGADQFRTATWGEIAHVRAPCPIFLFVPEGYSAGELG